MFTVTVKEIESKKRKEFHFSSKSKLLRAMEWLLDDMEIINNGGEIIIDKKHIRKIFADAFTSAKNQNEMFCLTMDGKRSGKQFMFLVEETITALIIPMELF